MTSIVTYVLRPKRAPRRKPKAAAVDLPPDEGKHSAIIAARKRGRGKTNAAWIDDGQETSPEVKAFFTRMMRPLE
jgi:hypothetical protein